MDLNPVDVIVRSLILAVVFLSLAYLFRGKIVIDGFAGYLVILFFLVPANVYLNSGGRFPGMETLTPPAMSAAIIIFNIVIGLILNKVVPGLSFSSYPTLVLFLVLFSIASGGVHYVPRIPTIL